MEVHGFTGHLVQPERWKDTAVIVLMGGEKSLLPGERVAQRFAEYRHLAMAVPLFGAAGLPDGPDRVPLDYIEKAVETLKTFKGVKHVATYGMSMGSLFAMEAALRIPGIDQCISVSGSHVIFEGAGDKHSNTGHSVMTFRGEELPFVPLDLSKKMWEAFRESYEDADRVEQAAVAIEDFPGELLILASDSDESWPAEQSARYLEKRLKKRAAPASYKIVVYKNASHILGMMPDPDTHKWLFRFSRVIYTSLRKHPKESLKALEQSQEEILTFLNHGKKVELHSPES